MSEDSPQRTNSVVRWLGCLPLASLIAVEVYASGFDGWGAWSTAPLFILPLIVSLVIGTAGAQQIATEARSGGVRGSTLAFTGLAWLPVAWLFVRRYFV